LTEDVAAKLIDIRSGSNKQYKLLDLLRQSIYLRLADYEDVRRAAYIFDPTQAGIQLTASAASLFSTHPPLAERLAAFGVKIKNTAT